MLGVFLISRLFIPIICWDHHSPHQALSPVITIKLRLRVACAGECVMCNINSFCNVIPGDNVYKLSKLMRRHLDTVCHHIHIVDCLFTIIFFGHSLDLN